MKKLTSYFNFQFSILTLSVLLAINCTHQDRGQTTEATEQYTCPMHPQIVQDMPGTCPICGMDLVRKLVQGKKIKITKELNYLLKPTNTLVVSSIKTVNPVQKEMEVKVEAKGVITHNTREVGIIAARFSGRIEKLYIKYNLQPIQKGQKIMEIYSPDLLTAQRELLFLMESDSGNEQLIAFAKQKLALLGLSEVQISRLMSSKQESYSFPIYSTMNGYVTEHAMTTISASEMPARSGQSAELEIREGMYVNAGQSIFTVVSHADLWAEFDLYQHDVPYIKLKDPVIISVDNSYGTMKATVDFIQPFFKSGENLTKVRVYLANAHHQNHAGQLVTATFISTTENFIWIPSTAMVDLGNQDVVFVKRRGVFKPKTISTGRQSGQWLQILHGLDLSDSIAYNAQFMVDSESFIKVSSK